MKIFIFTIITLGVIFLVCELFAYFWILRFSETGFYGRRPVVESFHPYLGWKHPANLELGGMECDSRGRSITATEGEKTIIVTGGSALFGIGQTDNSKTVASVLSKRLKMRGVNLGARAYRSFQEMLVLREYFLYERADIVVAVTGQIDSMYANSEPERPLLPNDTWNKAKFVNRAEEELPILQHVDGFIRKYSYSFDLFCRLVRKLIRKPGTQYIAQKKYELIPEQAKRTIDHYYMMRALCERNGAEFYVVLQPIRTDRSFLKAYYDELWKQGFDVIDMNLRDFLDETEFIDAAHYNDKGAKRLAEKIANWIGN